MKTLSLAEYEVLTEDAARLRSSPHGDKLLRLPDGSFLKLFRRKRRVSSAAWRPYAARFEQGARELSLRGVPTVRVTDRFRISERERDAVRYRPLPGDTLRANLALPDRAGELLPAFAGFVADLHGRGVYFRALHFDNVVVLPGQGFGLIDVCSARFSRGSLGVSRRVRNFGRFVVDRADREALEAYGGSAFLDRYLEASGLDALRASLLRGAVARLHRTFR